MFDLSCMVSNAVFCSMYDNIPIDNSDSVAARSAIDFEMVDSRQLKWSKKRLLAQSLRLVLSIQF